MTALMVAAELGFTEIVQLLLANGASVHTLCKVQCTFMCYTYTLHHDNNCIGGSLGTTICCTVRACGHGRFINPH